MGLAYVTTMTHAVTSARQLRRQLLVILIITISNTTTTTLHLPVVVYRQEAAHASKGSSSSEAQIVDTQYCVRQDDDAMALYISIRYIE